MGAIDRVVRGISAGALHLATAACLACFGLTCYAVAMRYFFGAPQPWIDHVGGWLVVAIVMFAAPAAQLGGEHVAVDTLTERARGGARRTLLAFGLLWVVATCAVMVWEGGAMVAFSRLTARLTEDEPVLPLWWLQVLVPIGFALMLVVALMQLGRLARGLDRGEDGAQDEAARLKSSPLE